MLVFQIILAVIAAIALLCLENAALSLASYASGGLFGLVVKLGSWTCSKIEKVLPRKISLFINAFLWITVLALPFHFLRHDNIWTLALLVWYAVSIYVYLEFYTGNEPEEKARKRRKIATAREKIDSLYIDESMKTQLRSVLRDAEDELDAAEKKRLREIRVADAREKIEKLDLDGVDGNLKEQLLRTLETGAAEKEHEEKLLSEIRQDRRDGVLKEIKEKSAASGGTDAGWFPDFWEEYEAEVERQQIEEEEEYLAMAEMEMEGN